MKACGALFVRTQKASTYINEYFAVAREGLAKAFVCSKIGSSDTVYLLIPQAKALSDSTEQVYLVIAVILLQSIGLSHQNSDERAASSIYHAMLVMMVRRAGLISKISAWTPSKADNVATMWHEWAFYETTKRQVITPRLTFSLISFGLEL
jgi:hypothetical protein